MGSDIDYGAVDPPPEKSPTEYSYVERRAEIAKLIEQQGHPHGFNKAELGRRYGVSRTQIRKDLDRLKDYYTDRLGIDAKVESELAYRKIVREHLDNGDYEKARRALDSWNGWLFDVGAQEKAPDKHEHQHGSLEEAFMADLRNAAGKDE
ncbi:hypothetical protein [Halocatena marina]|uniref:hypothetical protein n=1 Tax=Halocatena marina TaxID=2934937 RepID=UPI002010309F|nr:hypothetical protein [Halocatena marina]